MRPRHPLPLPLPLVLTWPVGAPGLMLVVLLLVVGCGPPPELPPSPAPPPAAPTGPVSGTPTGHPPVLPPPPATPSPGFAEDRAVSCADQPGGDEVLALLRAEGMLAEGTDATVAEGPLCAGTWQYAVISVPELEPLQVVTRGEPGALDLVTAGTEVCTVEVRVQAPSGIRFAADCVG